MQGPGLLCLENSKELTYKSRIHVIIPRKINLFEEAFITKKPTGRMRNDNKNTQCLQCN